MAGDDLTFWFIRPIAEQIYAVTTSWNLFSLLGVQPALGRFFTASDDRPDAMRCSFLPRVYGNGAMV